VAGSKPGLPTPDSSEDAAFSTWLHGRYIEALTLCRVGSDADAVSRQYDYTSGATVLVGEVSNLC
jgi:hypothetical protein